MKIIDAHAHIYPDKIADKAVETISDFYDIKHDMFSGTSESLIQSGSEIGVSKYLVFSTATTAHQVERINRFINSECSLHSEFIGLGTMHPDYENIEEELSFLRNHNIFGIKLHPDFQKFAVDDESLQPLYSCLQNEHMFLLSHSGDSRFSYSNPHRLAKVAKMYPKLRIIGAHFGGWSEWDEARECLNLPNVYFDTCSTLGFGAGEYALKMLDRCDKTHFFFGTDFPMWSHKKELERFMALNLPDDLAEDILYHNFSRFYDEQSSIVKKETL